MLKPYVGTSEEVVMACFHAIVSLEKERLFDEPMKKDDDISFNRARNELYGILDANGYSIEWTKDKLAKLKQGEAIVLSRKAA